MSRNTIALIMCLCMLITSFIVWDSRPANNMILIETTFHNFAGSENGLKVMRYLKSDGTITELSAYTNEGAIIIQESLLDR